MRSTRFPLAALALTGALLAGCAGTPASVTAEADTGAVTQTTTQTDPTLASSATVEEALAANLSSHASAGDADWDEADEVGIVLADGASTAAEDSVVIDGDTVTITQAGSYRLTGTLTDGQVVVDAAAGGTVRLILDGVSLTSSTTSPLVIAEADEAILVLADGTQNHLADAARTLPEDSDEPDAALASSVDLTISGTGALDVVGSTNDAIASTDGLVIDSGTLTVSSVDDGIRGKDYLVVEDGEITVTAAGDGLKSDNEEDEGAGYIAVLGGSLDVTSGGDGLAAASDVLVGDGQITVTSGGGASASLATDTSAKGLKAGAQVTVSGGTITVDAADDAVHSNGSITIGGGELSVTTGDDGLHADYSLTVTDGTITVADSVEALEAADITIVGGDLSLTATDDGINAASSETSDYSLTIAGGTVFVDAGGDGLDSNGSIDISGGTVVVFGPTESMNGAIDADGSITISDGVLLAVGSSGMAMAPGTSSPQASIMADLGWQSAGTVIQVVDAGGVVIAAFEPTKDFSSVVLSSPDIVAGANYAIYAGGTPSGTAMAQLSFAGDLTGASVLATVTGGEYAQQGMVGGPGQGQGPRPGRP